MLERRSHPDIATIKKGIWKHTRLRISKFVTMELRQAGAVVVVLLLACLSEAQWQARSLQGQNPNTFRLQSLVQAPLQSETRMPVFAPQGLSSQMSLGLAGGRPGQDPLGVQSKQLLQGPMEKLTWTFPILPEEPVQPAIPFALRHPISPNSVAAQCGESSVYVEVMEDFFGTGQLLMASGFALGGCAATGEDTNAHVLMFESELHGCGSMLTVRLPFLILTS